MNYRQCFDQHLSNRPDGWSCKHTLAFIWSCLNASIESLTYYSIAGAMLDVMTVCAAVEKVWI